MNQPIKNAEARAAHKALARFDRRLDRSVRYPKALRPPPEVLRILAWDKQQNLRVSVLLLDVLNLEHKTALLSRFGQEALFSPQDKLLNKLCFARIGVQTKL